MPHITPLLSTIRPTSPGEHAELAILRQLADGLPDAFHLFHSVDWTQAQPSGDHHGEFDIVAVNAAGDVAVLEIKSGTVTFGEDTVSKQYANGLKDVGRQVYWQFNGLLHRLRGEGLPVRLMHLLVLPDQRVAGSGSVAFPRERIADADDCHDLAGFLLDRLGTGRANDELRERVCAFMHNRIAVQPDLSALRSSLQQRVQAISGGLTTWVPRIQAPGGVVQVHGTAGSGKTLLALHLLRQARVQGQAAAYVCFTRVLADQMRDTAPGACSVATFHQLCWEAAGRPELVTDYAALGQVYLDTLDGREPDLDLLVLDELQDMQPEWVQALLSRMHRHGRIVLLGDPDQSLYTDREEFEIPDAVVVQAQENFRSPRKVVELINLLRLSGRPIEPCSPYVGEIPTLHVYDPTTSNVLRHTERAVRHCLERGFALDDIVVLSLRGRESSALQSLERLGGWPLIRFTGGYAAGEPVWTDGTLRIDTVRRFKGRCAPAVVLTEIDFDTLTPLLRRLLFVGMTRAQMHLELVLSPRAEVALGRELGG
jgi:RecB family endonuclease NucS